MSTFDFDKALDKVAEYEDFVRALPENLYPIQDWDMQVTMPEWMLDRLIPARSIGMLFGPSNSGKSHLICDFVASMLVGEEYWQGRHLSPGDVVMFSEAQGHILARLKAYIEHKAKPKVNALYALPTKAIGVEEVESLGKWMQKLPNPPKMVIFDTLATMFSFEENDNKEASKLIKRIEDCLVPYLDPLGCIVIVHHTSKASDGRSARGASALIGNIDWSINVQWDKEVEKTIAGWDKDRWRLIDQSPQWAGDAFRVPVNFTNGQADMMIVEWQEFSEETAEAVKQLKEDMKMDAVKAQVAEAIRLTNKPIYIHSNSDARVPVGVVPFRLKDIVKDTRMIAAMVEYIQDNFEHEPMFTKRGSQWGIKIVGGGQNVVGGESPI